MRSHTSEPCRWLWMLGSYFILSTMTWNKHTLTWHLKSSSLFFSGRVWHLEQEQNAVRLLSTLPSKFSPTSNEPSLFKVNIFTRVELSIGWTRWIFLNGLKFDTEWGTILLRNRPHSYSNNYVHLKHSFVVRDVAGPGVLRWLHFVEFALTNSWRNQRGGRSQDDG